MGFTPLLPVSTAGCALKATEPDWRRIARMQHRYDSLAVGDGSRELEAYDALVVPKTMHSVEGHLLETASWRGIRRSSEVEFPTPGALRSGLIHTAGPSSMDNTD